MAVLKQLQQSGRCTIVVGQESRCTDCLVREAGICAALTEPELSQLARTSRQVEKKPGEAIVRQGDAVEAYYNIVEGHVRVSRTTEDGRRFITGFLGRGDFIGLAQANEHAATVEAIDHVTLCRFPQRDLRALMEDLRPLERSLNSATAHELVLAQDHMMLLGCRTARERLATFLLSRLRRPPGGGLPTVIDLPMSQTDMADHLGLRLETVNRLLAALRRDGVIGRTVDRRALLLDRDSLRAMAGG
jgi:CRP/FNR family transcriptional regulator